MARRLQIEPLPAAPDYVSTVRGTSLFFALAFGITELLQLPGVLARFGVLPYPVERFVALGVLGCFGPVVAAVVVARLESGAAGVRALFRPLRTWRVGMRWYIVALTGFAAIYVGGTAVYKLCGGTVPVRWLYPPENGQHIAALVLMPIVEEPGWRGFALTRLQQRHGALKASLMLGVLWGFWHTTMFLFAGTTPSLFALAIANIVLGSVVFSWIYNHTHGSLLLAVLAHVGVHLNNPAHALPGNAGPMIIYTLAMGVAAGALVLADRKAWRTERAVEASGVT